jgi:hypothetical protein
MVLGCFIGGSAANKTPQTTNSRYPVLTVNKYLSAAPCFLCELRGSAYIKEKKNGKH